MEMRRLMKPEGRSLGHSPSSLWRMMWTGFMRLCTLPGCRLVVIDPVSEFLDGVDANSNMDVRRLLTRLGAPTGVVDYGPVTSKPLSSPLGLSL